MNNNKCLNSYNSIDKYQTSLRIANKRSVSRHKIDPAKKPNY